ncbi:hypothetical protein HYV71_04560 [Candidatus Uhrbacteria bacterium]|nr:hypothetical protein [Candidatus Uhrbacteria bacterium]
MDRHTRYEGEAGGSERADTKLPDSKRERVTSAIIANSFVLKSASPETVARQIKAGVPIQDLSFAQSYMAIGKNPDGAAAIEPIATIETSITSGMSKSALIEPIESALFDLGYVRGATYHFIGSSRKTIGKTTRNESFWYAHASPFDELENLQEGAHRRYIPLTTGDMQNLMDYKIVPSTEHGPLILHVADPNTPSESIPIPDASAKKLIDAMKRLEAKKKIDIIESLVALYGAELGFSDEQEQAAFLKSIAIPEHVRDASSHYERIKHQYKKFVSSCQITPEQLGEALLLANLLEELRQMDAYGNLIESSFRFLELMPKLQTIPLRGFQVLERSKLLGPKIIHLMKQVHRPEQKSDYSVIQALEESIRSGRTSVEKLRAFHEHETGEEEYTAEDRARELLEHYLGIPKESYRYLSRFADSIISGIAKRIFADRIGDQVSLSFIEPLNEIENCDALELMETAFGIGPIVEKYREEGVDLNIQHTDDLLARLTFEARRKLLMMMVEAQSLPHFEKKSNQGDAPFQHIWNAINTGPRFSVQLTTVYDSGGEMVSIITNNTPAAERNSYRKDTAHGYAFSTERSDRVREITLHNGKKILARVSKRPEKKFEDYMRKIFLGATEPTDFFGHEIIVEPSDAALLERKKQKLTLYEKGDEPGSVIDASREINEHALVFDLIDTFRANIKDGWDMKILDFRQTPRGTDYHLQGARAGSGGKVRLSKFVMRLTSPGGKVFDEEIQIFIPAHGKSGFFYHEEKKRDDARYQVERYLERLGSSARRRGAVASRSSLAELFLPPSIFSPTIEVYRRHKKNRK